MRFPSASSRSTKLLLAILAAAASVVCLYYPFFFSRGNLVSGDLVDNRLYIVLLEHWRAVFSGHAAMTSPNFFAPYPGALGLSESLFLYTPFYLTFSFLGADRALSFQLTLIALRLIGFFAVLALLCRGLKLSFIASLFGACLFTISNIYFVTEVHGVFAAVAFLPLFGVLLLGYVRRGSRACLWISAALAGLLFFTCYYMAFLGALAGIVFLLCSWPRVNKLQSRHVIRDLTVAALLFAIALIPFFLTYWPEFRSTGGRSYGESLVYARDWRELFDTGSKNMIWGKFDSAIYDAIRRPELEYGRGWPPVTMLTASILFLIALFRKQLARRRIAISIGATCALLYFVSVKYGTWSAWWIVYRLVPGSTGIRVPGRINNVINLGVVALCAIAIHWLWSGTRKRKLTAIALGLFLLIEQVNRAPLAMINRTVERSTFARIAPAPAFCKTFFAIDTRHPDDVGQVDAMLLARSSGIPTINGHSGWAPDGWDLHRFDADYPFEARTYALEHHLQSGFCNVDFSSGQWKLVDTTDGNRYQIGTEITFGAAGNSGKYKGGGWSYAEQAASWTRSPDATLLLKLDSPPQSKITLTGEMNGFTPPQHPRLSFAIVLNGTQIARFEAPPNFARFPIATAIPASVFRSGYNELTFRIDNPVSTAALGLSPDTRRLGLAVYWLKLGPAVP